MVTGTCIYRSLTLKIPGCSKVDNVWLLFFIFISEQWWIIHSILYKKQDNCAVMATGTYSNVKHYHQFHLQHHHLHVTVVMETDICILVM